MVAARGAEAAAGPARGARGGRLVRRVARRRDAPARFARRAMSRAPGGGPDAARRGDADGNAGWRRRRLGTGKRTDNKEDDELMKIKFHGHACFELSDGSATLLVDPFLKPNNPSAVHTADEVEPTHVLQTHGHQDHLADTRRRLQADRRADRCPHGARGLARRSRASRTRSIPTSAARVEFDWGSVKLVQAFHSNTTPDGTSIGQAAGLVINDRRQDDLPRRRHLPVRRHAADRASGRRSTSRSCRSAATTRWTATTPPTRPG